MMIADILSAIIKPFKLNLALFLQAHPLSRDDHHTQISSDLPAFKPKRTTDSINLAGLFARFVKMACICYNLTSFHNIGMTY